MANTYKIDILIHNDHGELFDKQFVFGSMDEMDGFLTNEGTMHNIWNEAWDYGHENGMLYEELEDRGSAEERDSTPSDGDQF